MNQPVQGTIAERLAGGGGETHSGQSAAWQTIEKAVGSSSKQQEREMQRDWCTLIAN